MAQLPAHDPVPRWALDDDHETPFWSVTRTADELSIICAYEAMPGTVTAVGPFAAFSIDGPLDHSLIGVLAGLTAAAGRGRDLDPGRSPRSTPTGSWCRSPRPTHAIEVWESAGHTVDIEELDAVSVTDAARASRPAASPPG